MKKSLDRKILGVFIFCFVSIVVCGIVPATKRNDIPLVLSKPNCHPSNNMVSISAENQSFLPLDWAVFYPFTTGNFSYNNNTGAFVAVASFFLKSNIQYNPNAPVPQAQVAIRNSSTSLTLLRPVINQVYDSSASTFHSRWLASGLFKSLQITLLTRSL